MSMSRVLWLVVVATAVAACGGGAEEPSASRTSASPSASQSPAASSPDRSERVVDAGDDLSDFVCAADDDGDGDWNASGVITNSTGQPADYRITVVVAGGPGVSLPGKSRTLIDLAPGVEEPFDVKRLAPTGDTDPTCNVEVLRLP
jgi:hypothetical protein